MVIKWGRLGVLLSLLAFLVSCGPASGLRKGEVAPDFALETLSGETVRLSDFRGKPVLINFWASWCLPCREEMPELQRAYQAHTDRGLVILAVNQLYQDDLQDVQSMVDDLELTFPILLERERTVADHYAIVTLPTSFFVDPEGRIHQIQVGPMAQPFVESVLKEIP